jgi:hypothetical protein
MQTNVQHGERVFAAKVDLEGKEDRLVKLTAVANGRSTVDLPSAVTDLVQFVVTDTNKGVGANVSCLPLSPDWNVRVALKGTCNSGTMLVLADPEADDGADAGKVTALPVTAGNYRVVGIAEEVGVNGQSVLMRPYFDLVTVTE